MFLKYTKILIQIFLIQLFEMHGVGRVQYDFRSFNMLLEPKSRLNSDAVSIWACMVVVETLLA